MNSWQQTEMRPKWWWPAVLALMAVALFPYGLLVQVSPAVSGVMWQYRATIYHVIGHLAVFTVLGTAVLLTFPRWRYRPRLYLAVMLLLGVVQEFLQLVGFKHRGLMADDFFDVAVDILAASVVYLISKRIWRKNDPQSNIKD